MESQDRLLSLVIVLMPCFDSQPVSPCVWWKDVRGAV